VPVSAAARVLSGRAYSAEETRRLVREAALDCTIVFGTQLVERGSVGALRKAMQACEQLRASTRIAQRLDVGAGSRERIEWYIDAIEVAVVLLAILQVIDDLQNGAHVI